LMRDHHRHRGRRPEDLVEPSRHDAHAAATPGPDANLLDEPVRQALAQLPEAQREVIILHWFEGLSFGEIAETVGAGRSAVKVRAHRGYKRMRELLDVTGQGSET